MSETGLSASLGLVRDPFVSRQLPSCCVLTWWGGERASSPVSLWCKGTHLTTTALPSWPCLVLITSQRPHLHTLPHSQVRLQHMNFEGTQRFSPQQKSYSNASGWLTPEP